MWSDAFEDRCQTEGPVIQILTLYLNIPAGVDCLEWTRRWQVVGARTTSAAARLAARREEDEGERILLRLPAARTGAVAPNPIHLHDNGTATADTSVPVGFM
jgi:hypothetical protein